MRREEAGELLAFMAVAEAGSFTRAAAKLATSQSALSHTVRRLEARVGLRLLARTTRSVALTEAGERLLSAIAPAFSEIDSGVAALNELRDKPAGTIRITTSEHAAYSVLWPALRPLVQSYPDLHVELVIDSGMVDIVTERFDAGVRLGESIAKDMVAVRIGPELRMAVVGAPSYFTKYKLPKTPQELAQHQCINLRLPTAGGLYVWELQKGARELHVRVDGQLVFNNPRMVVRAAVDGMGIACVLEDLVTDHIARGELVRLLADWCPPFAGYHLYYPSRRQPSAGFALVVEKLRYRP
ncbi:MAG: LysR family transcriptional regulator [Acidocella sp. 20-61-6]|jgi:DNA-binding transcriptional LysR family regulator|nr:MAG: LysR family transcriptional regulator [Acidocella sp. 20-61-6]